MRKISKMELQDILEKHLLWLQDEGGERTDLSKANLSKANLSEANLFRANLSGANLSEADLSKANLSEADLSKANLSEADLSGANLFHAHLSYAHLSHCNLSYAHLSYADLSGTRLINANLSHAHLFHVDFSHADLSKANLSEADLSGARLEGVKGLVKIMGVEVGNYYWKCIDEGLENNGYKFRVGLNRLRPDEVFANDPRVMCSHPGFHFASRSWCEREYSERRYLCKIRIPEGAQINEPWATDGKASADMIEIVQVLDTKDGYKDVTDQWRGK